MEPKKPAGTKKTTDTVADLEIIADRLNEVEIVSVTHAMSEAERVVMAFDPSPVVKKGASGATNSK